MSKDKLNPTERIGNSNPTQTLNLTNTNSNPEPCCESEDCHMDEEASSVSKIYKITIDALDFGYNVKVGCKTFAVEEIPKLIKNLETYLNNPKGTEGKWMKDKKLL